MGFRDYKKTWISIFKLARTYWQNLDCPPHCGEQHGTELPDNYEEEGYTRVDRNPRAVEPQKEVSSHKL